jgi:hypothetical protein
MHVPTVLIECIRCNTGGPLAAPGCEFAAWLVAAAALLFTIAVWLQGPGNVARTGRELSEPLPCPRPSAAWLIPLVEG